MIQLFAFFNAIFLQLLSSTVPRASIDAILRGIFELKGLIFVKATT